MRKVFTAILLLAWRQPAGGRQEEIFEKAYSMDGVSRVSIENVPQPHQATAWDKPCAKLKALKKAGRRRTLRLTEIASENRRRDSRRDHPALAAPASVLDFGGSTPAWITRSRSRRKPRCA
jgi:hypothetical protein